MGKRATYLPVLVAAIVFLSGCGDGKKYQMAMCALADVSGTYAKEKGRMVKIIQAGILPKMLPGDNLAVIEITSASYDEKNIRAQLSLDYRPSQANAQRMGFSKVLNDFANEKASSRYTDISGAMMLCSGYLKKSMAGTQVMLIFSDMKEELKPGLRRKFDKDEFHGIDIASMNVIKLNQDNFDPQIYRSRMGKWEEKVKQHGAKSWKDDIKPEEIGDYLDGLR